MTANDNQLTANLRLALRRSARSAAIITSIYREKRFAMTATAIAEVSMAPPSMLICVNESSSIYSALDAGADFGINFINSSHKELSKSCAGAATNEARFANAQWIESTFGIPRLADASASIICKNDLKLKYGTHGVFIGKVFEAFIQDPIDPLIYADGRYMTLIDLAVEG